MNDPIFSIFKHEFARRRLSLIAFSLISVAFAFMYTSLFPSIQSQAEQLTKTFEAFPKGFTQALGYDSINFGSLEQYLNIELFTITWPLLMILLAVSRAGATLSGEAEKGTLGLLLAQPISRQKMYLAKAAAGISQILLFTIVAVGSIVPLSWMFGLSIAFSRLMLLIILGSLFGIAVFSITLMISAISDDKGKTYAVSGGLLIVMYAINILSNLKHSLAWMGNASIFHYFNATDALVKGSLSTLPVIVLFITAFACLSLGNLLFNRRDLSV